jgi:molybdopterin-guanine dinucleotide biosynthesis protein A
MTRFSNNPDLPIGAILAGGEGRRLAQLSHPKPMTSLRGVSLMGHTINALTPQVRGLVLGLRAPDAWAGAFKLPLIIDSLTDIGPAASVMAVLTELKHQTDVVLTAPADCPFLPSDVAARLRAALTDDVDIAVATSGGQRHHLIALWRTRLALEIEGRIKNGDTAIHKLQNGFNVAEVDWPTAPFDPFFNINTPDDLTKADAICSSRT